MSGTYERLYNGIVLPLIWGGFRVLALFSPKVRIGIDGRHQLVERVRAFRPTVGDRRLYLFHCASAGELEALKPLLGEFDRSETALAVSYFSPSARRAISENDEFDFADYSPLDFAADVREYFKELRPSVVAITKHDIWPNYVWIAHEMGIKVFLINGNFHAHSLRLIPGFRHFHRAVYRVFTEILAVSTDDAQRARTIAGKDTRVSSVGDSRFDRVLRRAAERRPMPPEIENACHASRVLIAGSTHADDEELLLPIIPSLLQSYPDLRAIVVPHDPSVKAARRIKLQCQRYGLSVQDVDDGPPAGKAQVILINRSGVLADIYAYGTAAYVGGGFGKGVHSVLEPFAWGSPVLCGPNIGVSYEARLAREAGFLRVISGRRQAEAVLKEWLRDDAARSKRDLIRDFVRSRAGVASRIAERLRETAHAAT